HHGRGVWLGWSAVPYPGLGRVLVLGRDLSCERAAAEALEASVERFAALADLAPVGIFLSDPHGHFAYVNQRWSDITGLGREESLGRGWEGVLHPEERTEIDERWRRVARERGGFEGEIRLSTPQGRLVWALARVQPLRDSQGAVEGYLGILDDITERRELLEHLRVSQDKFAKAFRASPVWVAINALEDERFFEVNQAFLRVTGFDYQEVVGHTARELGLWPDLDHRRQLLARLRERGRLTDAEVTLRMKDGSLREFVWNAEEITIDGQRWSVNVLSDVTRLKSAERELSASEQRFRMLFHQLPIGSAVLSLDQRFLNVNPELCRFLGREREELLRLGLDEVTHPDDRQDFRLHLGRLVAREVEPVGQDQRFLRADGRVVWGRIWLRLVLDHRGQPLHLLPVIEDIDRLIRAEQARRELEARLERARRLESLGVMAAGVAHDFNNRLQVVISRLELAMMDLPEASPLRSNLDLALAEALRASNISHHMLAYSGHLPYVPAAVDLSDLVAVLLGRLTRDWPEPIRPRLELARELPTISGDPEQIEQALASLLANAREALEPKGGRIWVRTGLARPQPDQWEKALPGQDHPPGDYVYLEVEDDGPGVDPTHLDRIFEPFFTTKLPGRGLGLPLVLGVARNHRGGVMVDNRPGRGVGFRLLLPVDPAT
ncbi:MAG: PAS domain S-box protein, partial [Desulfarculus sp.]|nr:PAS domain S-box protein [Desulfarculus sp.]